MLVRVTSRDLTEWMAYYSVEPFGEREHEYRAALIASTMANTARDAKKHAQPFSPSEFMRESYLGEGSAEPDEDDSLMAKAMSIFGMFKKG